MHKFNFDLWKNTSIRKCDFYDDDQFPDWPCPYCWKSSLSLQDELKYVCKRPQEVNLEDYSYPFNGLLFCNSCKLMVSISGWFSIEIIDHQVESSNYRPIYLEIFEPIYFIPNLKLFNLEKYYPQEVCNILDKAFALFFL